MARFRPPRTLRALVGGVALVSGLVTLMLAAVTILIIHWELERQLDQRIELETHALLTYYQENGFAALARVVTLRDQRSPIGDTGYLSGVDESGRTTAYILTDASGRRRAGAFAAAMPPPGWSEFVHFRRPDGSIGTAQAMNSALSGGGRLVVAADRTVLNRMHVLILGVFAGGYGVLLLLNMAVTIGFARIVRRRLAGIGASAEAIMAGDLSRRMPLDGSGGEFDRLSAMLNHMLDRLDLALGNLKRASGDIAHDLRTPLQRVRGGLEQAVAEAGDTPLADRLRTTLEQTDDLLDLFAALLAIAEIEGQSTRARFRRLDLLATVADIVDAYRPAVEDSGRSLTLSGSPVTVRGDPRLLQQLVANLLDNALLHTPDGTHIAITVARADGTAVLTVADDGPGIPEAEHRRVFERLTRLDASRSTPGHGLGLSLVAAIATAHGGSFAIAPSAVGLAVQITLPGDGA